MQAGQVWAGIKIYVQSAEIFAQLLNQMSIDQLVLAKSFQNPVRLYIFLQAQAALASDPTNEELIRLQNDLEEVIKLTKDLLSSQGEEIFC